MESFRCPYGGAHDRPTECSGKSGVGVEERPDKPADKSANCPTDQTRQGMLKSPQKAPIRTTNKPQSTADRATDAGGRDSGCDDRPKIDSGCRLAQGTKMPDRAFEEYPSDKSGPTANNRTIVNEATERHICLGRS